MNAPLMEKFRFRGASPGGIIVSPTGWPRERYSGRIVVFEANRRVIEERNLELSRWVGEWRRAEGLPKTAGHIHLAEFPDCQTIDVMVWTAYRAFHLVRPNDIAPAPKRVLCFVNTRDLREWQRRCLPKGEPYSVHIRCCYTPDGEFPRHYIVLTCGG